MAGNKTAAGKQVSDEPQVAPWNEPAETGEPDVVTTTAGVNAVKKSFRDFNMRKRLEENPTTLYPFVYPGMGDTGYWLKIRSQHSAEYREAEQKAQRQISAMILAAGGEVDKVDPALIKDISLRAFTKLVAEWNFPDEMTEDNLVEFLTDNPIAYDEINTLAATDSLFF